VFLYRWVIGAALGGGRRHPTSLSFPNGFVTPSPGLSEGKQDAKLVTRPRFLFFYFCSIYWHEDLGLVKYYYKLCVTPTGIKEDRFEIVCSLSRTRKNKNCVTPVGMQDQVFIRPL